MPVVFAPAEPFSESISQGYGATEQFNKTLPTLANLYEANQRTALAHQQMGLQAAIQTAHNRTAAYQTDAGEQAQAEFQRRQFAQQQEMQAQSQALQWAMQDRAITHADTMQYQQQQNGVAQIMGMLSRNEITPEEAGSLTLKLKTGIDLFKQRQEREAAQNQQSLEKLHLHQAARTEAIQKLNDGLRSKSAEENTVTILDPKMELEERQKIAPQMNAMASVIGADAAKQWADKQVSDAVTMRGGANRSVLEGWDQYGQPKYKHPDKPTLPGHDKDLFDSQMKHAEANDKRWQADRDHYEAQYEKEQARVEKVMHEQEGRTGAIPADELRKKVTDNLEARKIFPPGDRPSMPTRPTAQTSNQPTGQQAPPNTPGQDAQVQNDQRDQVPPTIAKIEANDNLGIVKKEAAKNSYYRLKELNAKPNRSAEDLAEMERLLKHIASATG